MGKHHRCCRITLSPPNSCSPPRHALSGPSRKPQVTRNLGNTRASCRAYFGRTLAYTALRLRGTKHASLTLRLDTTTREAQTLSEGVGPVLPVGPPLPEPPP